jgi:S1-C subfamily serine protease
VNRLLTKVEEVLPYREEALPGDLRELVEGGPIEEDDITNDLVERVIGKTRDFLSIGFFEGGLSASRGVGRIVTHLGSGLVSYGTGFLVSPRLLLTNHHVLRAEDDAAISTVEFNYQMRFLALHWWCRDLSLIQEHFS